MTTPAAKLPALPAINTGNPSLDRWVQAVAERLEVREGARGNLDEKTVLRRDLESMGLNDLATLMATGGKGVLQRQSDGTFRYLDATGLADIIRETKLYQDLMRDAGTQATSDIIPERVRQLVAQGISDEESARKADIVKLERQIRSVTLEVATGFALPIVLNVKDQPYNAVGDGVVDDTSAILAAIAELQSPGSPGGVVYLPAGKYKVTSNLVITWPNTSDIFGGGKVVLRGAGATLACIEDHRTSVATGGCVSYDFSAYAGSLDAHFMLTWAGGYSLTRRVNYTVVAAGAYPTMGTGVGLYLHTVPGGIFQDMTISGYETCVKALDCLAITLRDLYISACDVGVNVSIVSFSEPTASAFDNLIVSACKTWGIKCIGGGPLVVSRGVYESIGYMGATAGAIYYQNSSSIRLPKGLTVDNAYFENNRGAADVYIETVTATSVDLACAVTNSMFARNSNTAYTTHCIYILATGTTKLDLLVSNNGFGGYSPYVASAGRKYINYGGTLTNVRPVYLSNRFTDATEDPTGLSTAATFASIGFGASTAHIYSSAADYLTLNGVAEVVPAGGIAPVTTEYYKLGWGALRWGEVWSKDCDISGVVTLSTASAIHFGPPASSTARITRSAGGALLFGGVTNSATVGVFDNVAFGPTGAASPVTCGASGLEWANIYSVLGHFGGNVTIDNPAGGAGSAYVGNSTLDYLSLNGVAEVIPSGGIAPVSTNFYQFGTTALRWGTMWSQNLDVSATFTWGAYGIPVPAGDTTKYLNNAGAWTVPAGGGGTPTLDAVIVAGSNANTRNFSIASINFGAGANARIAASAGGAVIMGGSVNPATVAVLDNSAIGPTTNNTITCGASGLAWSNVYSVLGTFSGAVTGASFNSITGLSSTTPAMNGSAAVGTATTAARADHVHPTDTTLAPKANPSLTGTVSIGSATLTNPTADYLRLDGVADVIPGGGIAPTTTNFYQFGSNTLRWGTMWSQNLNVSATFTWGAYGIPVPAGSTTTYLRNDGTWATPPGATNGTVTSVAAGAGLSGGTITTTGTHSIDYASTGQWTNGLVTSSGSTNSTAGLRVTSGNLLLATAASGISIVDGAGLAPMADNTHLLGGPSFRWTTVYATTGTINTSDRRDKCGIVDETLGLDFVGRLRPVSYHWAGKQGLGNATFHGLLAQDVRATLDEMGVASFAGWHIDPSDAGNGRQGLRYTEFIAPLIKAVQELAAQNAALLERVRALEAA